MSDNHATAMSLAFLLASIAACEKPPAPVETLRPVRSELVSAGAGTRSRTLSGTARAGQETQLSFRVNGRIDRLAVRVGENVRAGQLIASLEKEDFEIQVQQSKASLAQAEAAGRNAEANLDRIRGLWENKNASQNDLDSARASAESAVAGVDAARKALEGAERQLAYTRLAAPVDGAIASVPVEENENVRAGQPVAVLTSGSRPEVEVGMPEVLIASVQEGDAVSVAFDALPGETFDAQVTEVGVATVGTATTYPVKVRLASANSAIRSGMAANVSFRFRETAGERAIIVPSVAVGEDREGRFVYILLPSDEPGVGIVSRRPVETDPELTPDGIRIRSGLSEGERVVTAGVRRLSDGQRVKFEG